MCNDANSSTFSSSLFLFSVPTQQKVVIKSYSERILARTKAQNNALFCSLFTQDTVEEACNLSCRGETSAPDRRRGKGEKKFSCEETLSRRETTGKDSHLDQQIATTCNLHPIHTVVEDQHLQASTPLVRLEQNSKELCSGRQERCPPSPPRPCIQSILSVN